jgi:hypothetical protein
MIVVCPCIPFRLIAPILRAHTRWKEHVMLGDEPTVSKREEFTPGDEPTLSHLGQYSPNAPTWPLATERDQPPPGPRLGRPSIGCISATAFGASAVLFICVVALLSRAGLIALGPTAAGPALATSTPGATPGMTATPSLSPDAGWLLVAPASVQLGCDGDTRTQAVVLTNRGAQKVRWQAVQSLSKHRTGVETSPNDGELEAGASTTIQIQNQSHSGVRQGVISFTVTDPVAGSPATLSYTAVGCD